MIDSANNFKCPASYRDPNLDDLGEQYTAFKSSLSGPLIIISGETSLELEALVRKSKSSFLCGSFFPLLNSEFLGIDSNADTVRSQSVEKGISGGVVGPPIGTMTGERVKDAVLIFYHENSKRTPELLPFSDYRRRLVEMSAPLSGKVLNSGRSQADHDFVNAAMSAGLNDHQTDTFIELARKIIPEKTAFTLNNHDDLKGCLNVRLDKSIAVRGDVRFQTNLLICFLAYRNCI